MLQKLIQYYSLTAHPWEYWRSVFKKRNKEKLQVGFCGVFPPFQNGAAAGTYYLVRELAKHPSIELFLIPLKNKIDKKLFSFMPLRFTTLSDPSLDIILFWCLGDACETYAQQASCKTIAWQTMHNDPLTHEEEQSTLNSVKKTDLVLAITQWAYTCYRQQIKHVAYLPFGVDPSFFYSAPKQQNQFTCLFVSRVHYYKGIISFLDSIPLVLKHNKSIYFQVISPIDNNSPCLTEIYAKIEFLKKEYPFNFKITTTWIPYEEIPAYYSQADLLIFPSNNEGFGIPLLEAMSAEVPCIILDKKPMNEIVINEKTGYCIPFSKNLQKYHGFEFPDPILIAEKILYLKKHRILKEKMGKNCRERIIQKYNITLIINQLVEHCKRVVQERKL